MEQQKHTYLGNPNIKAANVAVQFEAWQIQELLRYMHDPIYFIENHVKIVHIDKGLIPFKLYDYQKQIINLAINNRFVILKMPRQSGKTTTMAACILHYILFQEHKTVAILANKAATAREILSRIQLMYENLPFWLQVGVTSWNKGSFSLNNGCKVIAASTSSSAIRGTSISWLVLDEFAFVPQNQANEFFESVYPTISSGNDSKIAIFSTPKGMNHFYKMWVEAVEKRSEFVPFEINWNDVPGRDEAWKEKTIANIGRESWEQEFEAQFLGSSNTLISPVVLKQLVHAQPIAKNGALKIYEEPQENHIYFLAVDCSRGAGLDYSVVQIIDITSYPFKQVGIYRDNKISHYVLSNTIVEIAKKYNNAYILIEINDIGEAIADSIYFEDEYENILPTGEAKQKVVLGSWKGAKNGLRMTKSIKRQGCLLLKDLIETKKLIIQDWSTIQELSTFILKGNTYEADESCNDDTVMALIIFAWATGQEYFKELMEQNLKAEDKAKTIEDNLNALYEELSPIGFIDGLNDQDDGFWKLS